MNLTQYLLNRLSQECGEVSHVCSKAMDFGLDSFNPSDTGKTSNESNIENELCDLLGVVELMIEQGLINSSWMNINKIQAKKEKVKRYAQLSMKLKHLDNTGIKLFESTKQDSNNIL